MARRHRIRKPALGEQSVGCVSRKRSAKQMVGMRIVSPVERGRKWASASNCACCRLNNHAAFGCAINIT
jgi:hypothetical protein